MKKSKKILIIVSIACILAGAAMTTGAVFALRQNTVSNADMALHETSHTVMEDFSDIIINTQNSSVAVLPAPDGVCRIVCDDSEKLYHRISVRQSADGTVLHITQVNEWQWYETLWGLQWDSDSALTVYLPKSGYEVVNLDTGSGDITIAPDFHFDVLSTNSVSGNTSLTDLQVNNLNACSSSGDLILRSIEAMEDVFVENVSGFTRAEFINAARMTVNASSGNIALENVSSGYLRTHAVSGQILVYDSSFRDTSHFETGSGNIEVVNSECGEQTAETVSGSVKLENARGNSLNLRTSSGEVFLLEALYSANTLCNTVSGSILFTGMDAENLEFITSSGDVSGNLLSGKNFIPETASGFVSIPPSDESAGTCHIRTVSGNISIAIES